MMIMVAMEIVFVADSRQLMNDNRRTITMHGSEGL